MIIPLETFAHLEEDWMIRVQFQGSMPLLVSTAASLQRPI
jgi:hypothetical protein